MSDLFDERGLRRALRLDGDELPPRFDPAALAAAARQAELAPRAVVAMLAGVLATGLVGALVWQGLFALAPVAGAALLTLAIAALTALAIVLVPVAQIAADPAVPASLLAVLTIVIANELFDRRERRHVHAS